MHCQLKLWRKVPFFGKVMKHSISSVITPRGFIWKNTISNFFQTGNFEPLCRKPLLSSFHLNLHKRISSTDSQGGSTQIFSMIIDCEAMDMLGYDISLFHGYSHFSRATSLDMVGIYSNDIIHCIHIKGGSLSNVSEKCGLRDDVFNTYF